MKKLSIVTIHIICWTVLLLYGYGSYLLKEDFSFYDIAFGMSISLVQVIQFYICYLWVYPRYMRRGKVPQLIGGLLVAFFVFVTCRYLLEEVIYRAVFGIHNYSDDTSLQHYILDNVYYGSFYIVVAGAAWGVVNAFQTEKHQRLLQAEAKKAELAFLKSQINPHFLYNTLNYVYSLAIPVSEKLADAVLKLSDLMRYTLQDSPDGMVLLHKEIEYLESYIALFRMRFEPAFYVRFSLQGIAEQKIASLLLIPFVENAFKHGVVNNPEYPVEITLKIIGKHLEFRVSNLINPGQKDHSSGIGLVNIQRRLDLIYPDQHELNVEKHENYYASSLIIALS
ncbi:sensor histidine kinase [Pedobacter sp. SAFR-022]|uniref:sensor histidine kinase n=1 Tax=Pedobacter sp. SAFR-022 TaxID=3436861 RepID=UPI003F8194A9